MEDIFITQSDLNEADNNIKQELINKIPEYVYNEINILNGASIKFLNEVIKLESFTLDSTGLKARAAEAKRYIDQYNGIKVINYTTLGQGLQDPGSINISIWRQLYLLERSIVPRNSRITWVARLKLFYNTYVLEHSVDHTPYKNSKFLFLKLSGDHNNLIYGQGNWVADFYYFDDTIDGTTFNKMVKVEFKYSPFDTLQKAINYYHPEQHHYTYNVTHVIIYQPGDGFYMVDYGQTPINPEKLNNINNPTNLLQ